MNKKKLKAKIKKLRIEKRMLRSDSLIEKESLTYRITFAESQVRSLIRDNHAMRDRLDVLEREKNAGNAKEAHRIQEFFADPRLAGTEEYAGDSKSNSKAN